MSTPVDLDRSKVTNGGHWMFGRILGLEGPESYRERGWNYYAASPSKPRNCSA